MSKFILMALLGLVSCSAMAGWVGLSTNEAMTLYVDPATIRKKGNIVKMWFLYDFKVAQRPGEKGYLSLKGQDEFDCAEEQSREITFSMFSENMGHGYQVSRFDRFAKWQPVPPGSVSEVTWKFACGVT